MTELSRRAPTRDLTRGLLAPAAPHTCPEIGGRAADIRATTVFAPQIAAGYTRSERSAGFEFSEKRPTQAGNRTAPRGPRLPTAWLFVSP